MMGVGGGMPDWMREGALAPHETPKRRSLAGVIGDAIRKRQNGAMIAGMLWPSCPVCGAVPGAWCDYRHPDFGPGTEMLQLDTGLLVCTARVQIAVDLRRVRLDAVLRRVPDWSPPPSLRTAG